MATLCLPGSLSRWALERRLWDAFVVFLIILSAVMATGLSWWNSSAPSQRGHFSHSTFPLLILGSIWLVPAISFHPKKKQGQYFPKSPETALCPFCLLVCLFCMLTKVRPGPLMKKLSPSSLSVLAYHDSRVHTCLLLVMGVPGS